LFGIFSSFGMFCEEESGNPGRNQRPALHKASTKMVSWNRPKVESRLTAKTKSNEENGHAFNGRNNGAAFFVDIQIADHQNFDIHFTNHQNVDIQITGRQNFNKQITNCQKVNIQITDHPIVDIQIVCM
jgi:hypothetical protein